MKNRFLLLACVSLALTACASGPGGGVLGGGPGPRSDGPSLRPIGDPGLVASVDIAFARAARDEGQWTAFASYAAPYAVYHDVTGPVLVSDYLAGRSDPAQPMIWGPRAVWSSCDGSLAVSFGRFQNSSGLVGNYATVWQLQSSGNYRFTYTMAVVDDPQPVIEELADPDLAPGEDFIVVTRIDAIDGRVADCRKAEPVLPRPLSVMANDALYETATSDDGTLSHRWEHHADGERRLLVSYLRLGEWQVALDVSSHNPGSGEAE